MMELLTKSYCADSYNGIVNFLISVNSASNISNSLNYVIGSLMIIIIFLVGNTVFRRKG